MLSKMLGGLISSEQKAEVITEIIKASLKSEAKKLGVDHKKIFFMIQPKDENFNFGIFLYKVQSPTPIYLREISLEQILGEYG